MRDLSRALLLDPSTLTPLLVKLETRGYIEKAKSKSDGRNLDITITDKGAKLEEKAISVPGIVRECIDLSEEEAKMLYNLTYKVLNNIERNKMQ